MLRNLPIKALLAILLLAAPSHAQGMGGKAGMGGNAGFGGGATSGTLNLAPGWTQGQDTFLNVSCGTTITCTSGDAYYPLPLTAGSVRILAVQCGGTGSGSTVTITSASINSVALNTNSSWVASLGQGDETAGAYGIGSGGTGGNLSITATMSGTCNNMFMSLIELIPPSGYTASLDQFTTATSASCTTCSLGAFSGGNALTATDAIYHYVEQEYVSPVQWNSVSGNYLLTNELNAIYLNAPSGTVSAPTVTMPSADPFTAFGFAFKATAGSFTVPTPVFSLVNYVNLGQTANNQPCNPTCTVTVPSTASGHLLFMAIFNSNGAVVSSMSGAGSWVTPTACQEAIVSTNFQLSCGYVLSSTSSVISISITMASNATIGVGYFDVSRTGGSFVLDTSGKSQLAASVTPQSDNLTLGGTNDVIFHMIAANGGIGGLTMDIQPGTNNAGAQFYVGEAACGILLNTTNGNGPFWVFQDDTASAVTEMAFK